MAYHDTALRSLVERVAVAPLRQLCQRPTVQAAYRIIAYYSDRQTYHSVATLICQRGQATHPLHVIYDGLFDHQAVVRHVAQTDVERFAKALQKAKFDTLADQPDLLRSPRVLWRVERAAGALYHQVLFAPDVPEKPYSQIANVIDAYLPEAIREVQR